MHDAIFWLSPRRISSLNIMLTRQPIAFFRITMPATAWCRQNNGIATRQDILLLWVHLLTIDAEHTGRARFAAFNAESRKDCTLSKE
jgi:hypothetical protein